MSLSRNGTIRTISAFGDIFVLDRRNGPLLTPVKDEAAPQGVDQMLCRIQFREASYDGTFTAPTSDRPYIMAPGNNGGSDWGSLSIDVRRGVIVANYNIFPSYMQLIPRATDDAMGVYYIGDPRSKMPRPGFNRPAADQPYGINLNQGWQMPTGLLCTQTPLRWHPSD